MTSATAAGSTPDGLTRLMLGVTISVVPDTVPNHSHAPCATDHGGQVVSPRCRYARHEVSGVKFQLGR